MARTGLRVGDRHRSTSPCSELPESAWQAETHTASCPAKGEQTHLCPGVPGNSGRTKMGNGMTPATQRGPLPLCSTNPKSGLLFNGSTSTLPTWASVSTESRLRGSRLPGREPLSRRGTCPEPKGGDGVHACLGCATVNPLGDLYGILPPCCPSWISQCGEKVNQCQEDGSQLQVVYDNWDSWSSSGKSMESFSVVHESMSTSSE